MVTSPSLACNETQQSYMYVDPTSGSTYEIECDTTYSGGVSNQTQQPDMASCIASCSDHIECDSAGYDETTDTCYEYSSQVQGSGTYNPNVQFAKITKRAVVVDGVTYTYPVTTSYITALPSSSSATSLAYYVKLGHSKRIVNTKLIVLELGHYVCFDVSVQRSWLFELALDKLTSEQLIIVELPACLSDDKLDQQRQYQQHRHQHQHHVCIAFFELNIRAECKSPAASRTKFNHQHYQQQFDFHHRPKFDLGLLLFKDYHHYRETYDDRHSDGVRLSYLSSEKNLV
ncbi:hypothetical protein KC332_g13453 [Hortaea werneckii]|nr:hypothetical protein KC358_g13361 [Hortaea werneckii]KAI6808907.1 hypothetical protein KC350_g13139 [Hortaea werneckii]KAI6905284.1 hypothetical protein KC348_g15017 [Hortaea werneckii]KAI6923145.1 hypothetical protein KC341_g14925 [Hortaea werneckii]KAI6959481.1 hypothetical protein KC321_g13396 [Hortaea werneckii]